MAHSSHIQDFECDYTKNIPDHLFQHMILSRIPYASFGPTKFVCKRFYSFCNTVSQSTGSINGLEGAINNLLDGINASDPFRHPWRLAYDYENGSTLRASVSCNWEFQMNFFKPEKTTSLFHLSLETKKTDSSESDPETMSFYVKSLDLRSVSSFATSNVVSSVVSRFDFLQHLHIEGCKMNTLYVSAPELRELRIIDCLLLKTVHVNAPKLEVFRYRGARPWFLAKGLDGTKLVEAMLDFRRGIHSKYLGSKLNLLLSVLKEVEVMTLCRATFEEVITSSQYTHCEKFKLEKLKEMWWIDNSVDKQRIDVLLTFLRICPALEKLYITIDPKSSWSRSMVKRFDRPVKKAELSKLELVMIEGCIDEEAATLLAEAITDSTTMRPVIYSRTNDGDYKTYMKLESEQINQSMRTGWPRSECTETKLAFKPVKSADKRMILELKHAHMGI